MSIIWSFIRGLNPFILLPTVLILWIIGISIFCQGIFLDGLVYAVISRNLGLDLCTFWQLKVHDAAPYFCSHPPLVFWIESFFYRILGDWFWIEKLYSFLTLICVFVLLKQIWIKITTNKTFFWIAQIAFISTPLVVWAFSNNILENSSTVFSIAAVNAALVGKAQQGYQRWIWVGLFVFLASLCKGPTGLFALSIPFWEYLLLNRKKLSYYIYSTVMTVSVLLLSYFLLILFSGKQGLDFFKNYLFVQLYQSLSGQLMKVDNRFYILGELVMQIIPMALTAFLIWLLLRKKIEHKNELLKYSIFFAFIGLSASLPILISVKQIGFYIVPALPYFALSFACFCFPYWKFISEWLLQQKKVVFYINLTLLLSIFAAGFAMFGRYGKVIRDQKLLNDVFIICNVVPPNTILDISGDMSEEWSLQTYLYRYGYINIKTEEKKATYSIRKKGAVTPDGYKQLKLSTELFNIYKKTTFSE